MSIRRHDLMCRFAQNQEAARSIPVTLIVGPGGSILSSPFFVPSPTCHLAVSRILALHHPNPFPHRCMCNWKSFMHSCILSLRMVYVWSMFATLLNALNNSNAPTIFRTRNPSQRISRWYPSIHRCMVFVGFLLPLPLYQVRNDAHSECMFTPRNRSMLVRTVRVLYQMCD